MHDGGDAYLLKLIVDDWDEEQARQILENYREAMPPAGQADAPSGSFRQVSAGAKHTCGVTASETIECWRLNEFDQADALSGSFQHVSAGKAHTGGVTNSGDLNCWGLNEDGQTDAP